MQTIATSKSDVAALPVKIGVGSDIAGQSSRFRDMLEEHKPVYRQPVEPRQQVEDRDPPRNAAADRAPNRVEPREVRNTPAPDRNAQDRPETSHREPANSNTDRTSQQRAERASQSRDQKPAEPASSPELQGAQPVTKTAGNDKQSDGLKTQDKQTSDDTEVAASSTDTSQTLEQDVDWVAYVEQVKQLTTGATDDKGSLADRLTAALLGPTRIDSETSDADPQAGEENSERPPLQGMLFTSELLAADADAPGVDDGEALIFKDVVAELEILPEGHLRNALDARLTESDLPEDSVENVPAEAPLNAFELLDELAQGEQEVSVQVTDDLTAATSKPLPEAQVQVDEITISIETDLQLVEENPADANPTATDESSADTPDAKPVVDFSWLQQPQQTLTALSDDKLQELAVQLERLLSKAPDNTQSVAPQQDLVFLANAGQSRDFISAMKAQLAEMKAQLQSGQETSVNVERMVASALQSATAGPVAMEQLQQVLSAAVAAREVPLPLMTNAETGSPLTAQGVERMALKESAVASVEQNRQSTMTQQLVDKAINITRQEGHQQLAERVRWMVNSGNLAADIRLDPPELGQMQVRVAVSGETASVNFVVQSPQARDVLDQAVPRLKELLQEQGIQLGQSSVQQDQKGQAQDGEGQSGQGHSASDNVDAEEQPVTETAVTNGTLGGIDYFV